jgi:hypothetical protein
MRHGKPVLYTIATGIAINMHIPRPVASGAPAETAQYNHESKLASQQIAALGGEMFLYNMK